MSSSAPLRHVAWFAISALIVWQAVAGMWSWREPLQRSFAAGHARRLLATTDERLAPELGEDFAVAAALREVARPGEWMFVKVAVAGMAPAAIEARTNRLRRMQHVFFPNPTPVLLPPNGDPVQLAEGMLRTGQSVLLLELDELPAPQGRAGWTELRTEQRGRIWRFQKD